MKQRKSRAERYEAGDGHLCSWIPLAAAAIGAAGSLLASKRANKANAEAAEDAGMPKWDPRQEPYLFGAKGWQPEIPGMSADAMNYMTALSGGFNPQYGPQAPMDFGKLLGGIESPGQGFNPGAPWYQDVASSPQQAGQYGGLAGLLGYGMGTPPPLFENNPYFNGQGVLDPQNLMQGQGGYDPAQQQQLPEQPGLLQAANASQAMPAPQQPQPAYMQQDAYGRPAWARDMVM